jgi:RNA polymerase sigma-70 factor (ECF subfamily)
VPHPAAGRGRSEHEGQDLDQEDIDEFVRTEYRRVVLGVSLVSGSLPAAEDAVQEALARAWERGERGERIESLTGWVMTVAMNLVKSGLRRRIRERRALARLEDPEERAALERTLLRSDEVLDLRGALQGLTERERQVTVLRYWLDLDLREIAGTLRVDEGTVKTLLFRARRKLSAALAAGPPEGAT